MVKQDLKTNDDNSLVDFIDIQSGKIYKDIWKHLSKGLWRDLMPENHEFNVIQGVSNRPKHKPVLKNILPIYPEMKWNSKKKQLEDPYFIPVKKAASLKDFLNASELFFNNFSNKKIGVQHSGGLDTGIIISLLKLFKIPFSLVGMTTNRYEFRTEKYIQNKLSEWSNEVTLIDYENHLPFFDLEKVPVFQYPEMLCLNYSSENAMALECERLGIEVLLTGNGGDNVFSDKIYENPIFSTWRPQIFTDNWLSDIVYSPRGVQLIPFFGDKLIIQVIYNLRIGQSEDNSKIWARNFFKDFLPQELVVNRQQKVD